MLIDLIQNIALLVMLAVALQMLTQRFAGRSLFYRVLTGLLFGGVGILVMMTPVHFAPGVIYDGRSIVLSLAGLFGGGLPAALAAVVSGAYRLHLGGAGAWVGVAVIVEAAFLGALLHSLRKSDPRWGGTGPLLLFALLVHGVMLALQLLIPGGVGWDVLRRFGLPIIIFYPLAFVLAAHVFFEGERRQAALAALQQSEEQYRSLFENNHVVMLIIDPEDGKIVDANPAALSFYGWSRDGLCGRKIDDINTLEPAETQSRITGAKETRQSRYQVQHYLADGSLRDVEVFSGPISYNGRQLLYSIIHDVTSRCETEEALRVSESLQRAMIACSPVALYSIDLEGIVRSWNDAAEKVFGWSAEEIMGRPLPIVPEDKEKEFFAHRQSLAAGRSFSGKEVVRLRKSGERFYGRLSTAPLRDGRENIIGIMAAFEDISAQKKAETERELLITAIEQAGEVIVITDAEGVIQYVNPVFETMTGYSKEEARGRTSRILKSGMQDDEFYQRMWTTISGGEIFQGRMVNKRKDGTFYTEDFTISPVTDSSGAITNFVAVKRDISDHLSLEEQFQQAQKMESVGRLAGGVAHDFNNMLSVILGYAELALEAVEPEEPLHEDILEIRKAAERATEITRQLLAFARKQTIAPQVIDLNKTVETSLKMLRRLIGEDIQLAWRPGRTLWPVWMDPSQIDQILANMCVNARDAIAGVGRITIETNTVSFDEEYCAEHPHFRPGDYVMLAISDDGSGMDKEVLENIFDPFFTTKEAGKGTGLGLAMVYGIVKQNNGFINIYSEPGQGTTFKIYLESHQGESEIVQQEVVDDVPPGRGETILVVEDEASILKLAKAMLGRLGYDVLTAATPNEAIELVGKYQQRIALVVTDVVMPEMNGRELAGRLQTRSPALKFLFMSGYTADVIAHHGVLDEGVRFIHKPFSLKDIAIKVRQAIEGDNGTLQRSV
ncbi:MAG: PAS domain S-box protein [Desulfopila sp.]|jgi:PAS domain S-box-containing protein|nr:PAS domain S-box protein [Desulfopila sp.]